MPANKRSTIGVLLMTMGDPPDLESVLPYLLKLFSDPLIVRAPGLVRYPLSLYISLKKLDVVKARYEAINGGSPMNQITNKQAALLEQELRRYGRFRVYVANRYSTPSTSEAYRRVKEDGIKKLVALPLYPHYSDAIAGSSFRELRKLMDKDMDSPEVVFINSIATDPRFVSAQLARIKKYLAFIPEVARNDVQVVFSAHSLPHEFVRQGDPYLDEITQAASALSEGLSRYRTYLGFQSKGRPGMEWLKPETDEVLGGLARKGYNKVLLVPISFVAENIETLYDCDIVYRNLAESLGIKKFIRARCLDDDPEFIAALAGIVLDRLA